MWREKKAKYSANRGLAIRSERVVCVGVLRLSGKGYASDIINGVCVWPSAVR